MTKKEIRKRFREQVFARDGHKCAVCDSDFKLDAHHITNRKKMPRGGYVPENGITLCCVCHKNAEQYHCSGDTFCIDGYWPHELYALIGSSLEAAREASVSILKDSS